LLFLPPQKTAPYKQVAATLSCRKSTFALKFLLTRKKHTQYQFNVKYFLHFPLPWDKKTYLLSLEGSGLTTGEQSEHYWGI